MTKTDLSLHLAAISILVALHAPLVALLVYLIGLLVGSARDDPQPPAGAAGWAGGRRAVEDDVVRRAWAGALHEAHVLQFSDAPADGAGREPEVRDELALRQRLRSAADAALPAGAGGTRRSRRAMCRPRLLRVHISSSGQMRPRAPWRAWGRFALRPPSAARALVETRPFSKLIASYPCFMDKSL